MHKASEPCGLRCRRGRAATSFNARRATSVFRTSCAAMAWTIAAPATAQTKTTVSDATMVTIFYQYRNFIFFWITKIDKFRPFVIYIYRTIWFEILNIQLLMAKFQVWTCTLYSLDTNSKIITMHVARLDKVANSEFGSTWLHKSHMFPVYSEHVWLSRSVLLCVVNFSLN